MRTHFPSGFDHLRQPSRLLSKRLLLNHSVLLSFLLLLTLVVSPSRLFGQASLPVDPGEIVATCSSGYLDSCPGPLNADAPVLVLFDTRDPVGQGAILDVNWAAPNFHNEPTTNPHYWSARNLGQVFGVALDDESNPNIYATASRMYGDWPDDEPGLWGPGGPGGVYKIDGTTGNICVLTSLPQPPLVAGQANGTGLGTLASMTTSTGVGFVFVTNFDDGLIYRVPTADCGVQPSSLMTFDHGVTARPQGGQTVIADDPSLRFSQGGRRVFGVGYNVNDSRLYYSVWSSGEIWSVEIDPVTGDFVPATSILEFTKPAGRPCSAITFSPAGNMYLAERTLFGDTGRLHECFRDAHDARVLEYQLVGGVWTPEPIGKYEVGALGTHKNAAGGVAVDCDENVWATGDAIHFGGSTGHSDLLYGMQRMPAGGNAGFSTSTSYVVDFDGISSLVKAELGQLAIRNDCEDCDFVVEQVLCDLEGEELTGDFVLTGTFTNLQDLPGTHLLLPPVAISPAGVQLCFGNGGNVMPLVPPLGNGDSINLGSTPDNEIIIKNAHPGDEVCFRMVLLGENGEECCTIEVCVVMPPCDCLQVDIRRSNFEIVSCDPLVVNYSFQLTNLFGQDVYHAFLAPISGVTFSPDYFDLFALNGGSPLGHGQSVILSTQITGGTIDDLIEVLIAIHTEDFSDCCSRPHQFTIPDLCDSDSFTVLQGDLVSGGMPEFTNSDDNDVSIQRSRGGVNAVVDVEVAATSRTIDPSSISFILESSVFARAGVTQVISAYNFQTGAFEVLDSRLASRFTDQTVSVQPNGDLTRFVDPLTGEMAAKVKFIGANSRLRFTTNIDRFEMITTE